MKNLIRSKEERIREQEAETARKTHEIASLEQSFSETGGGGGYSLVSLTSAIQVDR